MEEKGRQAVFLNADKGRRGVESAQGISTDKGLIRAPFCYSGALLRFDPLYRFSFSVWRCVAGSRGVWKESSFCLENMVVSPGSFWYYLIGTIWTGSGAGQWRSEGRDDYDFLMYDCEE